LRVFVPQARRSGGAMRLHPTHRLHQFSGNGEHEMKQVDWLWPNNRRIAVVLNVCLEAWSEGKAPGISPMGNPLPAIPGIVDTMAISWAAYGPKRGIYRLLDIFARHKTRASIMVNAVIAERYPEAVKAIAGGGHELLSHSYAMDVMPVMLSEDDDRKNIRRCTDLLEGVSGIKVKGWISPRATSSPATPRLLAEAGYQWYGDVLDEDLPYVQSFGEYKIVAVPSSTDVNDMPSMKYGSAPRSMLETFNECIDIALKQSREPTIIDVTVHAHIFGRPRGAYYLDKIVERAVGIEEVWLATRSDVAGCVLAQASR
jgi:peptidoglycan/xylan/chitin deacetylase (PgdA/CDA1 family)